jgi:hypothetical protein
LFKDGESGRLRYSIPAIVVGIDISRLFERIQFYRSDFFVFNKCFYQFGFIIAPNLCWYPFHFFAAVFVCPFNNNRHYQSAFIAEGEFVDIGVLILFFFSITKAFRIGGRYGYGKTYPLSFVGYEKEDVVIYSYLQADNVASVKDIKVVTSLMHDMFDDQTEIIHVIVNGKRQSKKLDYPETTCSFGF